MQGIYLKPQKLLRILGVDSIASIGLTSALPKHTHTSQLLIFLARKSFKM